MTNTPTMLAIMIKIDKQQFGKSIVTSDIGIINQETSGITPDVSSILLAKADLLKEKSDQPQQVKE